MSNETKQLHAIDGEQKSQLFASQSPENISYDQLMVWANEEATKHQCPEGCSWSLISADDPRFVQVNPPTPNPSFPIPNAVQKTSLQLQAEAQKEAIENPGPKNSTIKNPKKVDVDAQRPVKTANAKFVFVDSNNELFNEVQEDRQKKFKKANQLRANIDAQIEAHMKAFKPLQ